MSPVPVKNYVVNPVIKHDNSTFYEQLVSVYESIKVRQK